MFSNLFYFKCWEKWIWAYLGSKSWESKSLDFLALGLFFRLHATSSPPLIRPLIVISSWMDLTSPLLGNSTSLSLLNEMELTCSCRFWTVLLGKVPVVCSWRMIASYLIWFSNFLIDAEWLWRVKSVICMYWSVFCIKVKNIFSKNGFFSSCVWDASLGAAPWLLAQEKYRWFL